MTDNLQYIMKHELVANMVRTDILDGKLKVGEKLPPDSDLAERFGVNKRTVARGMASLVKEGLLSRATKRGTVVISDHVRLGRRSNAVCIIAVNRGHFYEELARSFNKRLFAAGLYPVWIDWEIYLETQLKPGNTLILQALENIVHDRPYGFIIDADRFMPFGFIKEHLAEMGRLVYFFHYLHNERLPGSYCQIDFRRNGWNLAEYFAGKGHRRMAFFTKEQPLRGAGYDLSPHELVVLGMEDYCDHFGLFFDRQTTDRFFNGELPVKILAELKEKGELPTAVATHSDAFCVRELLPVCASLGIRVPEDLSVLGYMNTPWTTEVKPQLSSVDCNAEALASESVRLLLEPELQKVTVEPTIVERNSILDLKSSVEKRNTP